MKTAPVPANEQERLEAVKKLGILDTKPEKRFDLITKEACKRLQVPISTITIIDKDREWYKSCQGLKVKQGNRDASFCGHAMLSPLIFIVEDTLKDERFFDNPMVVNPPFIRFYAGIALHEPFNNLPIGALCVKDYKPHKMTKEEINILMELAKKAEKELAKKQ